LSPLLPASALRPLRSSRWPGSGDRYKRSSVAAARSVIGWVRRMLAADEVLKNLYPSCHNKGCPPVRAMSVVGRYVKLHIAATMCSSELCEVRWHGSAGRSVVAGLRRSVEHGNST
jgi:hypothetical protein